MGHPSHRLRNVLNQTTIRIARRNKTSFLSKKINSLELTKKVYQNMQLFWTNLIFEPIS